MTKTVGVHFDTSYDVVARRIGENGHVAITVSSEGDFSLYFRSDGEARTFLAIALHELNRIKYPVEVEA